MRNPPTRTAYRIAGFYALSFAIASLLLGATTWSFTSRTLRHGLDERLQSDLATLLKAGAREGRAAMIADIIARDTVPGAGGYLLVDRSGHRVAGKVATKTPSVGLTDTLLPTADESFEPARVAAARTGSGELLAVVGEAGSLGRIETTLLMISAAGFGLMVAIGVSGGFLIGHSIHRRLGAVDATARAIIEGDPTRRMPIGARDDEFDRLSGTLNTMLDHSGRLMDSLRHVSDDIAHDLRTPLAGLRATLETASEAADSRPYAGVAEALIQVDALMALFTKILRISEVERGGVRGHFGEIRLGLLAAELGETYLPVALDSGRKLTTVIDVDLTVDGDEALLGQAIVNLLENAIKHTPPGTGITVTVSRLDEGRPVLAVTDDGRGIPADEHPVVLRRFGRRDASRATPGHGLGLTLVAAIAAAHRADLVLEDAAPGLSVILAFPRKV